LLERLNGGLYGDIHNILPNYFNKILDENELHAVSDDDEVVVCFSGDFK
jgi:protein MAK16